MHLKYYQLILGCQMNKSDAERLSSLFESLGFTRASKEEEANLICVQACSVRQSAVNRIKSRIKKWQGWQKERSNQNPLITVLTGCVLPKDRAVFKKEFDLVCATEELAKELPKKLTKVGCGLHVRIQKINGVLKVWGQEIPTKQSKVTSDDFFALKPKYSSWFQAYVPIQTGCNNFCTYCAVPYTKGREQYRPHKNIVQECENLVKDGYKEITLLGQNVNTYYDNFKCQISNVKSKSKILNLKNSVDFTALLRLINDIPGNFWIRFVSSNPWNMSLNIIKAVAECQKVCEYIHLPLQSGSDKVLKKMNRHHTQKDYLELIDKIRSTIPNVAITTDIIVGFPEETKKDFLETAKIMEKVGFDMAYIARYSPRPGTVAARYFRDNVPAAEKKRREKYLERILRKSALEKNQKYVGREVKVLAERMQKSKCKMQNENSKLKIFLGKTRTFKTVKFEGDKDLVGQFVKVKITKAREFGLEGRLG